MYNHYKIKFYKELHCKQKVDRKPPNAEQATKCKKIAFKAEIEIICPRICKLIAKNCASICFSYQKFSTKKLINILSNLLQNTKTLNKFFWKVCCQLKFIAKTKLNQCNLQSPANLL